ncbi:MAG: hypothetical protein R3B07_28605 [Polyangiaceae bacterium]
MNRLSLVPVLFGGLFALQGCAESDTSSFSSGGSGGSGNAGAAGSAGTAGSQNGGSGGSVAGNGGVGGSSGAATGGTGGSTAGAGGTAGTSGGTGGATGGTGGAAGGTGGTTGGTGGTTGGTGGAAGGTGGTTGGAGGTTGGTGGAAGGTGGTGGSTGGTGGMSGNCMQLTATPIYLLDGAGPYVYFSNGPNLGDSSLQDFLFYEFYSDATGTFDLMSAGDNDNYETCTQCLRMLEDVYSGGTPTVFYQTSGTITVTGAPSSGTPQFTMTNVTLSEVTVSPTTYHSTLVPGGACYTINSPTTSTAISTPPEDSCAGFCEDLNGSFPTNGCYCDVDCLGFGDCCSDYTAVCP